MVDRVLSVYTNDHARLVFVSIFRVDGKVRKNSLFSTQYSKAKYAFDQALEKNFSSVILKAFDNGFYLALMNTSRDDWQETHYCDRVYSENEVAAVVEDLYEQFENQGYKEVGSRHLRTGAGGNGAIVKWGLAKIQNMKMDKIIFEIKRMTIGLEIDKSFITRMYLDTQRRKDIEHKAHLFLHIQRSLPRIQIA